MIYKTLYRK